MKVNLLRSFFIIAFTTALLVSGATLAWFTSGAGIEPNVFTAGTVEITAGDVSLGGSGNWQNWNPGDCNTVTWSITNSGSTDIYLRVKKIDGWSCANSDCQLETSGEVVHECEHSLSTDKVEWNLSPAVSGWEYDESEGYWYYCRRYLEVGETVDIAFSLRLDASLGNEYQDRQYYFYFLVEAVQATNNAIDYTWPDHPCRFR